MMILIKVHHDELNNNHHHRTTVDYVEVVPFKNYVKVFDVVQKNSYKNFVVHPLIHLHTMQCHFNNKMHL